MSDFNIAAKSKDEQDKVNVDLAASGVAYKERLNMPVIAEHYAAESIRSALHRHGITEREEVTTLTHRR